MHCNNMFTSVWVYLVVSSFFFQCCYSLIDSLLEGTDLTGNIAQAVDVILCPDVSFLQVQSFKTYYIE